MYTLSTFVKKILPRFCKVYDNLLYIREKTRDEIVCHIVICIIIYNSKRTKKYWTNKIP